MARKIESWEKEIFKDSKNFTSNHSELKGRELVIVASSILDIGLAHLIEKRLHQNKNELEDFLGLDRDGRAPLGSFGAKIQMAFLLKLVTDEEMVAYRAMKAIRNRYAHEVNRTALSKEVNLDIQKLIPFFMKYIMGRFEVFSDLPENVREDFLRKAISSSEKTADAFLHLVFSFLQVILDARIKETKSLDEEDKMKENLKTSLAALKSSGKN